MQSGNTPRTGQTDEIHHLCAPPSSSPLQFTDVQGQAVSAISVDSFSRSLSLKSSDLLLSTASWGKKSELSYQADLYQQQSSLHFIKYNVSLMQG